MPRNSEAALPQAAYRWSTRLAVDPGYAPLQHLGNVELARLFSSARVRFIDHLIARMIGEEDFANQLIVHIDMEFFAEIRWVQELKIDLRVGHIGKTSLGIDLAIFGVGKISSRCVTTSVWMHDGKPAALSGEAKALLDAFR